MLTLPLDPTDDLAHPIFNDAASCARWLAQLQLTNLQLAHSQLSGQIGELNRYAMRGLERMRTLELLRETVSYVQADYAKKLIAKPLPLNEAELVIFVSIVRLWQEMVTGYQRCLQAYMAGDAQLAGHGALLCQRCLLYSGLQIFEHLRTGYEFEDKLWHQLHALYAFAEEQGLQLEEVADDLDGQATTCRGVYVKTLLACHAKPAELSRSQLQLLDRWLSQWSKGVYVERSYTKSKGDAPPLAVDLSSYHGLQPLSQVAAGEQIRFLPMVPISKLLRVKTILLQQGQSPQQLELGSGCNSADCADFLVYLHQCWCEDHGHRFGERHSSAQETQACHSPEAIHSHVAGKPFKQPGKPGGMDSAARRQIETYGRVITESAKKDPLEAVFPLENWRIEDESILGARLIREDAAGERVRLNQLIGIRPRDSESFQLGSIAWANVARNGQLHVGVRYFPGVPEAVAMKATGINQSVSDKYVPVFLLPAVPALRTPPSLIIPRDWFQPNRVIEILNQDQEKQNVKMGFSVERGLDYERVSFTYTQV